MTSMLGFPRKQAAKTEAALISVRRLSKTYIMGEETVTALRDVSVEIEAVLRHGAASETIPAGTDITLTAGEATFVTATATGTLRNASPAPAAGLITLFVASADGS